MKKLIKISEINPNDENPRYISKDKFQKLVKSIKDFPEMLEKRPLVVDENMIVLGGNMRLKALKEAGIKETYVDVAEGWTDEQKKEFIIKDNVGFGEWDWDILANEWSADDLESWGMELPIDWNSSEELEAQDDNYEMPDEIKTDIVHGDLFEIGEHRLLCGDSTSSDDVELLMNGEKADIMVTDPPYGIDLDTDYSKMPGTTTKYDKIDGDDSEFDLKDIISISNTKEQYIWGGDYFTNSIDWISGTPIVWAKRHSEKENKVFGSAFEILWVSYKCKKQIWFIRPINQSSERLGVHPTQKPIECMSRAIEMSKSQGIIYEPFCGSGSTMVASHQLKRKCNAIELSPKYCQVIIDRMMKLDPTLKIKKNGEDYTLPS